MLNVAFLSKYPTWANGITNVRLEEWSPTITLGRGISPNFKLLITFTTSRLPALTSPLSHPLPRPRRLGESSGKWQDVKFLKIYFFSRYRPHESFKYTISNLYHQSGILNFDHELRKQVTNTNRQSLLYALRDWI